MEPSIRSCRGQHVPWGGLVVTLPVAPYGCGVNDWSGSSALVLLLRHAEARYETEGSGDSGGNLTPVGREQARQLGRRLKAFRPSTLLCSELSRAVQTAEIAASVLSIPVEVRVGLQEYDVGEERGRPYNAALFEPLLRQWLCGQLSAGIPGGEDGHSVAARMFAVLDDATRRHPGETLAVVSHGGAINAVIGSLTGEISEPSTISLELPPCGMVALTKPDGQWELSAIEPA